MKKFVRVSVFFFVSLISSSSFASVYQGTVASVYPYQDKIYIVVTGGSFGGTPTSCTIGFDSMVFVFDGTTAAGKNLMATVLLAKVSGKTVYAVGDGNCGTWNPYNGKSNEGLVGIDLKG